MKIQLISDVHLEAHPDWHASPLADADVLVLAGDIGSYQAQSQLTDSDFGLARFSPLRGWPTPVIFVPGNHEYDNMDFDAAHARLQDTCARLGLTWLERSETIIQGVRFVGTTLWSDFDALAPSVGADPSGARTLKAREKAFRAANFYLRKAAITRHGEPWLAAQMREQALACQAWLRDAFARPHDGPTVVVSHFAPSLRSADPRYGLTPGTAGFCNALDALFPATDAWLHGHLHAPCDYTVSGCQVVANPLGYARKGEQAGFRPDACVVIDPSARRRRSPSSESAP